MPTIQAISAMPYDLPLRSALTWGAGHELRHLRHALVRVELSDGAVGFAESTPRPTIYGETQASVLHIVERHLAPRLLGEAVSDFASVAALSAGLARIKGNNTAKGALDMALHQALCGSRGESLTAYLGAERDAIELSYIVSTGAAAAVMTDVEAAHQAGLRVFKLKIGVDLAREEATIGGLIARYPRARFYADANETLPVDEAAAILTRLHELGVMYCEEPLPIELTRARAKLRRECAMPVIADDSVFTPGDLARELEVDSFDILNIKTARTGFSDSARMLERAAAGGKGAMAGSQASSLLGCLQAAVFAGKAEVDCPSECSFYLKTEADVVWAPAVVDGAWDMREVEAGLAGLQAGLRGFA